MMVIEEQLETRPASVPSLPEAVMERLRLRANNLRMLPAIATQALEVAKDPNCAINEFAAVVERDATLAADILRLSNSILFASTRQVLNLHQAVVRIGFRQCKNLIMASSFSSMMKKMSVDEEWIRELLWRHSYVTALVALNLNRSLSAGFQGEEFAGGLIHDIGRMLMAVCYPDQFNAIDPMTFEESADMLDAEAGVLQTNHCEIGFWFARKNSLPDALADVVRFHHSPERSEHHRRFVALIAASDHMANHLQRFEEARDYDHGQNTAVTVLEACGVKDAVARFGAIAGDVMQTAYRDASESFAL